MNMTVLDRKADPATEPNRPAQAYMGFVDCDVHPYTKGPNDFDPFLSKRWLEHKRTIGNRSSTQSLKPTSTLAITLSPGLRRFRSPCR